MDHRKPAFTVEPSKAGPPTLAAVIAGRTVYLHSRVDPSREETLFSGVLAPEKYDLLVVLGLGLGYHLAPVADTARRYRRIVLVDALEGVEKHWDGPVRSLLNDPDRVQILTGSEPEHLESALASLLSLEGITGVQVLEHPASLRAFTGYYTAVKSIIENCINRAASNRATVGAFGYRYLVNSIHNLAILPRMRPLAPLSGRFATYPAVVVTPGPSLDAFIDALRDNQDRVFIVAADSALPVLTHTGVTADFLVSVDPQVHLYEHFVHGRMDRTVPVYTLPVNPLPFRRFPGLVYLNSHPLCQLIEEYTPGLFGSADSAAGTVAGDAVMLARRLGFRTLGLAGFDFSFPRFCIYARGSSYQERFGKYFQTRTFPVETRNASYIRGSSRGERFGALYTRKSFLRYREGIGRVIAEGGTEAVSLTTGGVPPEGVPFVEPDEFFRRCGKPLDKERIIAQSLKRVPLLSERFDPNTVLELLMRDDILSPLLRASLQAEPGTALYDRAGVRIKNHIRNILGI